MRELNQIRYLTAMLIWPGLMVALIAAFAPPTYTSDYGYVHLMPRLIFGTIFGAGLLWLITRRGSWPFPLLVLIALPCFIVGFGMAGVGTQNS